MTFGWMPAFAVTAAITAAPDGGVPGAQSVSRR
jgi:hypothetical protein